MKDMFFFRKEESQSLSVSDEISRYCHLKEIYVVSLTFSSDHFYAKKIKQTIFQFFATRALIFFNEKLFLALSFFMCEEIMCENNALRIDKYKITVEPYVLLMTQWILQS
jgi:hypothetical protein